MSIAVQAIGPYDDGCHGVAHKQYSLSPGWSREGKTQSGLPLCPERLKIPLCPEHSGQSVAEALLVIVSHPHCPRRGKVVAKAEMATPLDTATTAVVPARRVEVLLVQETLEVLLVLGTIACCLAAAFAVVHMRRKRRLLDECQRRTVHLVGDQDRRSLIDLMTMRVMRTTGH